MRKIAIIGGTGIYSPETLQCFEEKVIQLLMEQLYVILEQCAAIR